MAHNRAQLNDLIFHNRIVLPLTSPGYARVTLAVAELQGGNNAKAATHAEEAYVQDPTLAAAWLAKTAADVFEATSDDLRQDRALFCVERALECAPTCRREIIEFFVSNILGHYVEVLCATSLGELAHWMELETYADELADRAFSVDWQAVQMRGSAALLEAASLVTGVVALFSRRLGTQVFSGVASAAAFSEAARLNRDAALLEGMAAELRAAGHALRLEGKGHRSASMLYLVPARDLVGVAARLLQAEGLPPQSLDRLINSFTAGFRQVLSGNLQQLSREVGVPMSLAINGNADSLASTYRQESGPNRVDASSLASWHQVITSRQNSGPITKSEEGHLYAGINPVSRDTLLWLAHMVPGVRRLEAHQLLATPMPFLSKRLYRFNQGTWGTSLPKRMDSTYKMSTGKGGCLVVVTLVSLFLPPVFLLMAVVTIAYAVVSYQHRRARAQAQALVSSLWSVDTWLRRSALESIGGHPAVGAHGLNGSPPLPTEVQQGKPSAKTTLPPFTFLTVIGAVLLLVFGLLLVLSFVGSNSGGSSATKKPEVPEASVAAGDTATPKPTPEVRQAIPVHGPAVPPPLLARPPSASLPAEQLYTVTGLASDDTLNVRSGPGVNNRVIARLPNGTAHLGVTGASVMNGVTEWVPIGFGDRTGWVTKQHLQHE